jgi:hypothetical protein
LPSAYHRAWDELASSKAFCIGDVGFPPSSPLREVLICFNMSTSKAFFYEYAIGFYEIWDRS